MASDTKNLDHVENRVTYKFIQEKVKLSIYKLQEAYSNYYKAVNCLSLAQSLPLENIISLGINVVAKLTGEIVNDLAKENNALCVECIKAKGTELANEELALLLPTTYEEYAMLASMGLLDSDGTTLTAKELIERGLLDKVFYIDEQFGDLNTTSREDAIQAVTTAFSQYMLLNGFTIDKNDKIYDANGNIISYSDLVKKISDGLSDNNKELFAEASAIVDGFVQYSLRERLGIEEKTIGEELADPFVKTGSSVVNGLKAFASGFYDGYDSYSDWFNTNITANVWYAARTVGSLIDPSIDPNYAYDQIARIVKNDLKAEYLDAVNSTGWGKFTENNSFDFLKQSGVGFSVMQGLGTTGFNATAGMIVGANYTPAISYITGAGRSAEFEFNERGQNGNYGEIYSQVALMSNFTGVKEAAQYYLGGKIIPGWNPTKDAVANSALRVGANAIINGTDNVFESGAASVIFGGTFDNNYNNVYGGTASTLSSLGVGALGDIAGELLNYGKPTGGNNDRPVNFDEYKETLGEWRAEEMALREYNLERYGYPYVYSNFSPESFNYGKYQQLSDAMLSAAVDENARATADEILRYGGTDGYSVNTYVRDMRDDQSYEVGRRASMAYVAATTPETFNYIKDNDIAMFHGTNSNALPGIIDNGLNSIDVIRQNGGTLVSGETWTMDYRANRNSTDFVSVTPDIDIASNYALSDSSADYGVVIGISGDDLDNLKRVHVSSAIPEIGIKNGVPTDKISFIGVPQSQLEAVKEMVGDKNIEVMPLDFDNKFYAVDEGAILIDESKIPSI